MKEILEKIAYLSREAIKAQESASRRNMRCMDLPPRAR
jgi:hypothetical protein